MRYLASDFSFDSAGIMRIMATGFVLFILLAGSLIADIGCSESSDDDLLPSETFGKVETGQNQIEKTQDAGGESEEPLADKCGDGICDQFEKDKGICPEDCAGDIEVEYEEIGQDEYYVINQTSGSKLYVRFFPAENAKGAAPTI